MTTPKHTKSTTPMFVPSAPDTERSRIPLQTALKTVMARPKVGAMSTLADHVGMQRAGVSNRATIFEYLR
jgi:hypothetical protein